ncbi:MAG: glycosyltransferase [Candidatus Lokiarchaeota archaeon]|nr:glycosyltransferase [Candidatus Lokiarchaeota archaeon]
MRIFQISNTFYPVIGGIETYIDSLSKRLVFESHNIYVITRKFRNKIDDGKFNYQVIRLNRHKTLESLDKYIRSIKLSIIYSYIPIKKIVLELQPDVLNFHSRRFFFHSRLFKRPSVLTIHTTYFWHLKKIPIRKLFLDSFDVILCFTKYLKKIIDKISPSKAIFLPYGIDTNKFSPNINENMIRNKYEIKKNEKLILCVGRLVPYKGFDTVIKAMQFILKKNKNFKLMIVGDGPQLFKLKQLSRKYNLKNNVIFTNKVDYSLLQFYYAACDIFIHVPYKFEAFGRVLIEAMASKKPVISTYCGGPEEIIDHNKNGLLLKSNNPQKISETILNLYHDEAFSKMLSINALKKVKSVYSWEIIIKKYLKILNSLT